MSALQRKPRKKANRCDSDISAISRKCGAITNDGLKRLKQMENLNIHIKERIDSGEYDTRPSIKLTLKALAYKIEQGIKLMHSERRLLMLEGYI
jgi:hypothetical protein